MKKNFIMILVTMLLLALSSCSLARDDEYYTEREKEKDYYLPARIEFEGTVDGREINVEDYFYVSFNCPGKSVWDACMSCDISESIECSKIVSDTKVDIINGVEQPKKTTIIIDLTFYARENRELILYSIFVLENRNGEEKRVPSNGSGLYNRRQSEE